MPNLWLCRFFFLFWLHVPYTVQYIKLFLWAVNYMGKCETTKIMHQDPNCWVNKKGKDLMDILEEGWNLTSPSYMTATYSFITRSHLRSYVQSCAILLSAEEPNGSSSTAAHSQRQHLMLQTVNHPPLFGAQHRTEYQKKSLLTHLTLSLPWR